MKMEVKTAMGMATAIEYDDGIANGIKIMLGDDIVALLDVYADGSEARLIIYEPDIDEPTQVININI